MKKWNITAASVLGRSHEASQTVCQDAYQLKRLENNWGIVALADGAGSYDNSERGSAFTTRRAIQKLSELLQAKQWKEKNELPEEELWQEEAFQLFVQLRQEIQELADQTVEDIMEYSCTLILLLYSPKGLCVAHVGDGRAAYLSKNKEWCPLISPYEGEVAGSTVFITQDLWVKDKDSYFEAKVINEKIRGFSVMTDGMESASFQTRKWNDTKDQVLTLNLPDKGFFNAVTTTFLKLQKENKTPDQIKARWVSFMESGNEVLKGEQDDKTFILGLYA